MRSPLLAAAPPYAVLAVALSCATFAAPARAQSDGISLQRALDDALERGAQPRLGARQVQIGEGALLAARAPFDARFVTSISSERSNGFPAAPHGAAADATLTSTLTSTVAVAKRFRWGVELTPHVELARTEVGGVPGAVASTASLGVDIALPLLRDRGANLASSAERAARYALRAARSDARHVAASSTLAAAVAYWNYVAAEQRLEVYRSSEKRAERLVDDTRRLVDADERPAADLPQLRANVESKRAARLAGEQAMVEAGEQLAMAIGARVESGAELPRAATRFPIPAGAASAEGGPRAGVAARASRSRSDLAALGAARAAASERLRAARDGLRSRLDLTVRVGYRGAAASRGVGGTLASIYSNVPGIDLSVQFGYELSFASAARGEALRSYAALEQARIREAELSRAIASGVRVARQALEHGRAALLASRGAATLSREAVENEKRKFRLGMSTLFDVILAEDALTNARLGEIAGSLAYAVAIARLRYETGTLLAAGDGAPTVDAGALMEEP